MTPSQPNRPGHAQHTSSTITVGGPGGVVIHGDRVEVAGQVIHPGSARQLAPQTAALPRPAHSARASLNQSDLDTELFRHPGRLPALMLGSSVLLALIAALMASPLWAMPMLFVHLATAGSVAALVASFLLRSRAKALANSRALPLDLELGLLELAHAQGGELSVPGTARALKISLDEAQEALGRLAKRGYAELEVSSQGDMVYKITEGASQASTPQLPSARPHDTSSL